MSNTINRNFINACVKGDLDKVILNLEKGATMINNGFVFACYSGHFPVVEYLSRHYNIQCINFCLKNLKEKINIGKTENQRKIANYITIIDYFKNFS